MSSERHDPPTPGREHPVTVFAERLTARLDDLAGVPLMSMDEAAKRQALVTLATARAKFDALALRLLADAEASQACVETGAATAAGWLAVHTRQTRLEARSDLRLATRLESLPVLSAGMATGGVNTAQARAIVAALDRLPTEASSRCRPTSSRRRRPAWWVWPRRTTPPSSRRWVGRSSR